MKLKELNEAIAAACDVQPKVVGAVLTEAFKQIRTAVQKGEKLTIPEFGVFVAKEVATDGDGGTRPSLRFRERSPDEDEQKKAKRAEKKAKKAAEAGSGTSSGGDQDDDGDED